MSFDDSCNSGLVLGLGLSPTPNNYNNAIKRSTGYKLEPSLTLSLSGDPLLTVVAGADQLCRQTSSLSGVSSFSSGRVVKRERYSGEESPEEEETTERVVSDYREDEGVSARKKLRLTKEQSDLLEESFKHHSTLNPKQKQVLARELNLRPRQVEVWFQNRRARTKLKQTEVDCEVLKKCCETLTDENMRLRKEIQELKTLKLSNQPVYMHMPASTLTMCSSCERIGAGGGRNGGGSGGSMATTVVVDGDRAKGAFSISSKPHFFNPYTNPSAAC
ncbi:PREDICTED: homeobox-leucine zipper protein HAT9-like [Camelina sativa]|uniref:Homeobox-leucine zipper protein HAT9-like n=1 Tax=Camelina sativa TaxID=90675 RepID=A0ABM0SW93_CAMSA|nr:PREDICTED: homeobox-leucine zipper protein HAT9-like [Camelina sativa]